MADQQPDETPCAAATGAPRGRPRDADADARILKAAIDLLGRDGYARMSLDAVAAEAGVSRPAIYRRYAGKTELAAAALAALAADRDGTAPEPAGELRGDLLAQARHFREGVSRPYGLALVGTVLAEETGTPGLLAMYREHVVAPRRAMVRAVLEAARRRGEIRAGADLEMAAAMLIGALYAQRLAEPSLPPDWDARVVDAVLDGIRERSPGGSGAP